MLSPLQYLYFYLHFSFCTLSLSQVYIFIHIDRLYVIKGELSAVLRQLLVNESPLKVFYFT